VSRYFLRNVPTQVEAAIPVAFPEKWAEFEIQACALWILRRRYPNTRGEVVCKTGTKNRRGARFDLVVFDENEQPLLIIEVKNSGDGTKPSKCSHYEELTGLPSIHIWTMEQAKDIVAIVREALDLHYAEATQE